SRWLNDTTSHRFLPARTSERMRLRIFSPGWRRIVSRTPGYLASKRTRSGSASCVFIAVYHTTSLSVIPAWAGIQTRGRSVARLVRHIHVLDLRVAEQLVERMLAADAARLEAAEGRALEALVAVAVDPHVARLHRVRHAQSGRDVVGPDVGAQAI